MHWLFLLIYILIISGFLLLGFIVFVAYKMAKPPRLIGDWTPQDFGFEYRDVEFTTEDGLKLSGWWISNGSDKTVIPLHGYTRSRWDDVYMKPLTEFLLREGYNVLTFDFRAHGKSEGKYTGAGEEEIKDVRAAIEWLKKNQPEKSKRVALIGFSMGAIVTIRSLADIPEACCGVADSPPIYMEKTSARSLTYFANLPQWLYFLIKPFSGLFGEIPGDTIPYSERIKKPLLLIAGEKDPLVMVEEVREFYERNRKVNPNVELWVTDAAHVRTLKFHPEEWKAKVREFLRKYL